MLNNDINIKEFLRLLHLNNYINEDIPLATSYPSDFFSHVNQTNLDNEKTQLENIKIRDVDSILKSQVDLVTSIDKSIQHFKKNLIEHDLEQVEDYSSYYHNLETPLKNIITNELHVSLDSSVEKTASLIKETSVFVENVMIILKESFAKKTTIGDEYNKKIFQINHRAEEIKKENDKLAIEEELKYRSVINTIYQTLDQVNTDPESFKLSLQASNDENEIFYLNQIEKLKKDFKEKELLIFKEIENGFEKIKLGLYEQHTEQIEHDLNFNDEKDQLLKSLKHQILNAEKLNDEDAIKKLLKEFDKIQNTKLVPISDKLDKQAEKENTKFKDDQLVKLKELEIDMLTEINNIRIKIANFSVDLQEQLELGVNNQDFLQISMQREITEKTVAYLTESENRDFEYHKEILALEKEKNELLVEKDFSYREIDIKCEKELSTLYHKLYIDYLQKALEFAIVLLKDDISKVKKQQAFIDFKYALINKSIIDNFNRKKFATGNFENIIFNTTRKIESIDEFKFNMGIERLKLSYRQACLEAKEKFFNDPSSSYETKLDYYQEVYKNHEMLRNLKFKSDSILDEHQDEKLLEDHLVTIFTSLEEELKTLKSKIANEKDSDIQRFANEIENLQQSLNTSKQQFLDTRASLEKKLSEKLLLLDSYIYDLPNELDKQKKQLHNKFLANVAIVKNDVEEKISSTKELLIFADETINSSIISTDSKLVSDKKAFNKNREITRIQLTKILNKNISDLDKKYKELAK